LWVSIGNSKENDPFDIKRRAGRYSGLCPGNGNRSRDSCETSRKRARFAVCALGRRRYRGSASNRFGFFIEFRWGDPHPFGSARRARISKEIGKRPLNCASVRILRDAGGICSQNARMISSSARRRPRYGSLLLNPLSLRRFTAMLSGCHAMNSRDQCSPKAALSSLFAKWPRRPLKNSHCIRAAALDQLLSPRQL
jgi:hypothetical protein